MSKWTECSIHTTEQAIEPVSYILHQAGASGVVIEDSADLTRLWDEAEDEMYKLSAEDYPEEGAIVKAYFPANEYVGETIKKIKAALKDLPLYGIEPGSVDVVLADVYEEDWENSWKQYYKPVRMSETLTVAPSWEVYVPESPLEKVIELDPGMAFGTGTHPTTMLCIQALERELNGGETVLDVGTGSGILAIAAAKLGAAEVKAFDLDDIAVRSALENVEYNKCTSVVQVTKNDLLADSSVQADLIVANILADIIIRLLDGAYSQLKAGGVFITSGIIESKRNQVEQALLYTGFENLEVHTMEDWVLFKAVKPE